ncbi:hypothetical protein LWI28_012856 [Acer negundo]|uniref:Uncharacterized protein n=1 Tax=Acer negundo TaxID=4023 RepID=A0AAD5J5I0_ACENE|nr:hypothetical protein LWI28_012856 [Acer negundo]
MVRGLGFDDDLVVVEEYGGGGGGDDVGVDFNDFKIVQTACLNFGKDWFDILRCNFLNYRRNMACFHCDCKRPPDEFLENKMEERRQGPNMRTEKIAKRPEVSNAWNFDFDDDESDGADVAAFEYADSPSRGEDSTMDLTPPKLELTVKLDHNNFLLWRKQVFAAIKGNRLAHFLDSTISPPNRLDPDGSVREEFLDWEQQDQILLCWLLSSVSQEILPQLVGCLTACQAWNTIERFFSSQSRANLIQLKLQLQTLKKASMTMTEYLLKKKSIINALAYSGYGMTEEDKIMYVLSGLGAEYDSFVIPITSMQNYYTMPEIIALLLTHEARIEQHTQTETLNVNLTNKRGNGNNQQGFGRGQSQNWNNGGRNGGNQNQRGRRGRGRGRYNNSNNKIQC